MIKKVFLGMLALIFLLGCSNNLDSKQVRRDVNDYFATLDQRASGGRGTMTCAFNITYYEVVELFSSSERAFAKVIVSTKRTCKRNSNPMNLSNSYGDQIALRKIGQTLYENCLELHYNGYDQGYQLANIMPEARCTESEQYKAIKKQRYETILRDTALAACYCKSHNCEQEAVIDECGVTEEKDLNGDGINELLVADNCAGNGGYCSSNLWSMVEGSPRNILEWAPPIKDIASNSDGSYPHIYATEGAGAGKAIRYMYVFYVNQGRYVRHSETKIKVRKITFVGLEDTEVYINGVLRGKLRPLIANQAAELLIDDLPDFPFVIILKKEGYKTFTFRWNWNDVPHVYEALDGSGYLYQELEKE